MYKRQLADGATTRELDELSIRTAAGLIVEEPRYSRLAGRLLATYIDKEVRNQNIPWFTESVIRGHELGVIGDNALAFVLDNASTLNAAINSNRDRNYTGGVVETRRHELTHLRLNSITVLHFLRLLFLDPYNTDVVNNSFLDPGTKQP